MLDHERVGTQLYLFHHQPEYALAVGHREVLGRIVERGEKAFETFGQSQVCLCISQVRLQGGKLGLEGRLAPSQVWQALA